MEYDVQDNVLGGQTVFYHCEHCLRPVESPLDEAGTEHPCPLCGCSIVTPT